ncbi:hypothetical protein BD779DRAFT_1684536 [Infundibulicybe gibba]|nr:hypothetical protein BD779DRAFT_1684536 [Infundibulicybe gibba]
MALMCRHFFDTSVDCLWRRVPSLFLVLSCLPSNIWRAPLTFGGIANATLARAIVPADLERFNNISKTKEHYGLYGHYGTL